jgi:hypothetical protein
MNQLRARAKSEGLLKSLYEVLDCELEAMEAEKNREIVKFEELSNDEIRLQKYQKDSGLTKDICNRILTEVKHDRETCNKFRMLRPEENAVYGERDLKTLYRVDSQVREAWKGMKGQKPVDLIVLGLSAEETLLGDCKFGLKRDDPWMIRNEEQFKKEFLEKFTSVSSCIQNNDGIAPCSEMLLVVTSALAPLLKNRIEDFKLDSKYAGIPYDKIKVCSVDDIYSLCQKLLPSFIQ